MDALKTISSFLFIFGLPVLCLILAFQNRREKQSKPFLGWFLLIVGGGMCLFTFSMSSLAILSVVGRVKFSLKHELIGFLVWFLPSFMLALSGWLLIKKPEN